MARESAPLAETKASTEISGKTETTPTALASKRAVPVVEIPEKIFEFGAMNENRDYTHSFVIKNVGTSELVIQKILPG
jgi:archaellum component FlaG (FlaF/FlaG flagellin family)